MVPRTEISGWPTEIFHQITYGNSPTLPPRKARKKKKKKKVPQADDSVKKAS
jgi:hypothetical protein